MKRGERGREKRREKRREGRREGGREGERQRVQRNEKHSLHIISFHVHCDIRCK